MIEYIVFKPTYNENGKPLVQDPDLMLNLQHNRAALAEGVDGVKCMAVGKAEELVPNLSEIKTELFRRPHMWPIYGICGSAELYEDGALNIYVKVPGDQVAKGFIRVRS